MATSMRLPKQWEDWVSWLLGFWLLLSPWALSYSEDIPALRNAVTIGFVLIFVEVVTLSIFRPWEEWINVLIGVWLIAAPVVLDFISPTGTANAVIVGAVVLLLAFYEIWRLSRRRGSET